MTKAEYLHEYYLANKKRLNAYRKAWYRANKERVFANVREYEAAHPEQVKKWGRQKSQRYRSAHPERLTKEARREARRAEYHQNRETIIARSRAWRAANPGATWEQVKAWKAKNPDAYKLLKSSDRARRAGAEKQRIHVSTLQKLIKKQNGCCAYCNCLLEQFHIDHKIPLSRGGKHVEENLALACAKCNLRKNKKTADEFITMNQRELSADAEQS